MRAEPVAIVVLAAGASRRYGGIKLLAPTSSGEALLRRTARVCLEAALGPVLVVLGAHRRELVLTLEGLAVQTVGNPNWREGMGRSIATGIARVRLHHNEAAGAVLVPADLPHVTAAHLAALPRQARRTGRAMAATAGPGGLPQAPAHFSRQLFPLLENLVGDRGARHILRADPSAVTVVEASFPLEDLDTPPPPRS